MDAAAGKLVGIRQTLMMSDADEGMGGKSMSLSGDNIFEISNQKYHR